MEDVTDADYTHAKIFCKGFEIKNKVSIMLCILKGLHYFWRMFSKT